MYARVTTLQVQPDKIDETIGIVRDLTVPNAKQQPGFAGLLLLTDRATGKSLAVSLWETEAALTRSEAGGYYRDQTTKLVRLLTRPPARQVYAAEPLGLALAQHAGQARTLVGVLMNRDVITVPPTMPVAELAALLAERRISGAPVVDDTGRVLGVVSEVDILGRPGATAGDIMSRGVISVSEDTEIEEVAHLFLNQRIRRVPVLADGRLVGIVSRSDLLRPAAVGEIRGSLDIVQESSRTVGPLDIVQHASEESFPASDPPTWSRTPPGEGD